MHGAVWQPGTTRRSCSSWASGRRCCGGRRASAELLADGGRFVIRYDHRDTGRSVTYDPGRPGYTGADLVADATGVLDAYEFPVAHIVLGRLGGRRVRAAPRFDHPIASRSLVLDQHLARAAGDARAAAADRRVRPVRLVRRGRLVGRRLGDRLPRRLLARARRRAASVRRGAARASCVATSSAPATSRPSRTTTCCPKARLERVAVLDRLANPGRFTAPPIRCFRSSTVKRWWRRSPSEAAAAGGSRPRRLPGRLGGDRRCDPRAHCGKRLGRLPDERSGRDSNPRALADRLLSRQLQ